MIRTYQDLLVWQRSRELVKNVYLLTKEFPAEERYGLTSQTQRAAISVPSNIAEGFGRKSNQEFKRFLLISFGSLTELQTQITLAGDLEYIKDQEVQSINNEIDEICKMINGLLKKLKID